ncbi:MAG: hypothetical protein LAP21_07795 [Acidobacteriia bacterium]|nr:hypothetical protein [Terriglobia bacterium]
MTTATRKFLFVIVFLASAQPAMPQRSNKVTVETAELARINLTDLFQHADTVARVTIVAGDIENYDVAVYKARVVQSFKGAAAGETLYFGPHIGKRLGSEYIVFLHNVEKPLAPKTSANGGYGTIRYAEVPNQGYGAMETSYECVFDGREISQQCDDAVRICTDYITLPKSIPTFPPMDQHTPFGCRWARKQVFVSTLVTEGWRKEGS